MRNLGRTLLCCSAVLFFATANLAQTVTISDAASLAELQSAVTEHGGAIRSFQITGVVCAVVRERRLVALQDNTGTVLLELPAADEAVNEGDRLTLRGTNCAITRSRFGIQIPTAVVDNDGRHSALVKSGTVFLEAGLQPLHVEWFNGPAEAVLHLEYSGPGVGREEVPDSLFWRNPQPGSMPGQDRPGLDFTAYNGAWLGLPDFAGLTPVAHGVATNLSVAYRARPEQTGLVFNGFINIDQEGVYTFYLTSDDGGRLKVGHPAFSCQVEAGSPDSVPEPKTLAQALTDRSRDSWVELKGEVAFAGDSQGCLEMDLSEQGNHWPVTVMDGASMPSTGLLHRQVRVKGICELFPEGGEGGGARLVVPSVEQMEIYPMALSQVEISSTNALLTTAAQVRQLAPEQARQRLPARVAGVVIAAAPNSAVLQDASGGVFIHFTAHDWFGQPAVGQFWEFEGGTGSGDFAPVIFASQASFLGNAVMPEPIHPTRDQLMNGSLDSEYVEVHGVVTAVSNTGVVLLTPDGKVTVRSDAHRPLPQRPASEMGGGLAPGNIVRIRGCFTAEWNAHTRQAIGGSFFLYPPTVEVEELQPPDPFSLPTRRTADLSGFDARARALQRTKIAGQIIHTRQGEFILLDGQTGVRILPAQPQPWQTGDLVEAVGFPQLGGAGPILQEAQVRKMGQTPLPEPVSVPANDLLDQKHNYTLVRVQAWVVSDAVQMDQRVLELEAGLHHFLATLNVKGKNPAALSPGSWLQLTGVYSSTGEDLHQSAQNSFALWLNDAADIVVLKPAPWWTLRRAIIVAAALAGGLSLALVWISLLRRKVEQRTTLLQKEILARQRVEQHRVMERERTRVAQDLHDELGVGLTQVSLLGSLAKNPSLSTERKDLYLDQLSEAARNLVTGLDEIVWAINPKYDSVPALASYYALFTQRFLNLAGIACRFEAEDSLADYPLDSRLRHGIFLACKEALNNVVRHAGATEVRLKISVAQNHLMISISDNGCGFNSTPGEPGHDGLPGMARRMQDLGGRCIVTSHAGRGTTVQFSLPLEQPRA